MKCPKCGYISFDFNDACPKCRRDLAVERQRLNLPLFRPDPPLLIGALIGESNTSGEKIRLEGPGKSDGALEPLQEAAFGAEDSQAIQDLELAFKDSQAVDFQLEALPETEEGEAPRPEAPSVYGDSLKLDLADLQLEDDGGLTTGEASSEAASEEPLFVSTDARETGAEDLVFPSDEELSLEIEDLVIDDLPLEPVLSEGWQGRDPPEKTTLMKPQAQDIAPPSAGPTEGEPVPPAEPEGEAPKSPRMDVFFDLEDIKEDEIASIRMPPPAEKQETRTTAQSEEPSAPEDSRPRPPGKPAVSEELKTDWEEFNLDLDLDRDGPNRK